MSIEPFWIALTLKEKRHYEVCLERVFTRLAGVGLERLGEEARHRRLVMVFLSTQHMIKKPGLALHSLVSPSSRSRSTGRLRLCTSQTYLSRSIGTQKTQRDRADVSCQNINSDKAGPAVKVSSSS